jgi:hypothetical protein
MESEANKSGAAIGSASAPIGREADRLAALGTALREIVEKVEANIPLNSISEAYREPLAALVTLAGQTRDVNMLARMHAVTSILEAEDRTPGQVTTLTAQIGQVEQLLQARIRQPQPVARGIIADQAQVSAAPPVDPGASESSACELLLRTLPSMGEQQILALKTHDLLDSQKLLTIDALELGKIGGLSTNTAFEIKDVLRREAELRAKRDLERRVAELSRINEQLGTECDGLEGANQTLLANNKILKNQYPAITTQHDAEVKNFRDIQSRVVSARLESNRLSTEINFLRDEHRRLLDLVEEKHVVLDDLLRRFNGVRCSFEFVSGETAAAQDVMANVEGLLKRALSQKKVLNQKIATSEESIEKLLTEFNEIVRRGKTEFYRSI